MKKFSITQPISAILRLFTLFLICLIWCRYFIKSFAPSIFVAGIFTLVFEYILHVISKRKLNKNSLKQEELDKIQNYANTFIFSGNSKSVDFFYELAKLKHNCTKKSKYIEIICGESKIILYPLFLYKPFDDNNLAEIYKSLYKVAYKRLVICTNQIDIKALTLANKLPKEIFVLDAMETYKRLFKKYDFYPKEMELKSQTKNKYYEMANFALNKKRTKSYFVASLFLILSSFISPYKLYYLIFATLLLSLSFISLLNPKFNKVTQVELFEN